MQKRIVGDATVDALYANAPEDQQHLQGLLSANCFGDHYTRTGLDVPTRELLTFADAGRARRCGRTGARTRGAPT